MRYVAAARGLSAFTCPHCGVLARQEWHSCRITLEGGSRYIDADPVATGCCEHCQESTVWYEERLLFPLWGEAPPPSSDLPPDVRRDYEEAASISVMSPRGAAALLRLAVQKLCVHLGEDGKNLNDDIANLVRRGMGSTVQKALDVVRVVGNNAVHPGQIDVDDSSTVGGLFAIINLIAESMITMPARVESMYAALPAGAVQAIQRRDGPPSAGAVPSAPSAPHARS